MESLPPPPFFLPASFDSSNGSYNARLPVALAPLSRISILTREILAMGKKNFVRINFLLQHFFRSFDPLGRIVVESMIIDANYPICGRSWMMTNIRSIEFETKQIRKRFGKFEPRTLTARLIYPSLTPSDINSLVDSDFVSMEFRPFSCQRALPLSLPPLFPKIHLTFFLRV